jgi:hypothetical protein
MPRFRFSLRSFFLFLIVACLIGSNLFTAREVNRLNEKLSESYRANEKLQAELGLLVVTDPNKLHAVAVQTQESLTWRWRLHVPTGRRFRLFMATQEIPDNCLPTNHSSSGLVEGDFTATAAIRKGHLDKWMFRVMYPSGSTGMAFSDERSEWIVNHPGSSESQAGSNDSESTNPGETMVLLRFRVMQRAGDGSSSSVAEPCDGVMIWIAEESRP